MKSKTLEKILVLTFVTLTLTITMGMACNYLIKHFDYMMMEKSINLLKDEAIVFDDNLKIDFSKLANINKDIIGWLEVKELDISYPILKDTNYYYLRRNYDKRLNINGSIFTNRNVLFEEPETEIYGSNLQNGLMFSKIEDNLSKINDLKIKIYTSQNEYELKIFSVYSGKEKNIKNLGFEEKIEIYKKSSILDLEDNFFIKNIVKICFKSDLGKMNYIVGSI